MRMLLPTQIMVTAYVFTRSSLHRATESTRMMWVPLVRPVPLYADSPFHVFTFVDAKNNKSPRLVASEVSTPWTHVPLPIASSTLRPHLTLCSAAPLTAVGYCQGGCFLFEPIEHREEGQAYWQRTSDEACNENLGRSGAGAD